MVGSEISEMREELREANRRLDRLEKGWVEEVEGHKIDSKGSDWEELRSEKREEGSEEASEELEE